MKTGSAPRAAYASITVGYHIPPRDGAVHVGGNMERGIDNQSIDITDKNRSGKNGETKHIQVKIKPIQVYNYMKRNNTVQTQKLNN